MNRQENLNDVSIAIHTSRIKTLLLLGICLLFVVFCIAYILARRPDIIMGCGAVFFGLGTLVFLLYLVWPQPFLCATHEGIDYCLFPLIRKGHIPWQDVTAIFFMRKKTSNPFAKLYGRQEIILFANTMSSPMHFPEWQVPRSAARSLAEIARRYGSEIERYGIQTMGIEQAQ